MALYLVTFNGWVEGYGAEIYLIGIFDNLEDATNTIPKNEEGQQSFKIHVVDLNKAYQIRSQRFPYRASYETDVYLGGYVE